MASIDRQAEISGAVGGRVWPGRLLTALLVVLFCGPLIAPLFQASGLPLLADSGDLARRLLASYICPTPAKSYVLLGFPMAVCVRCWGATIGLWLGWGLFMVLAGRRAHAGGRSAGAPAPHRLTVDDTLLIVERVLARPWPARLALAALPFLLWVAEIAWWPGAPYAVLLLNGVQAGLCAGLFFCSIWPGLASARRTRR